MVRAKISSVVKYSWVSISVAIDYVEADELQCHVVASYGKINNIEYSHVKALLWVTM